MSVIYVQEQPDAKSCAPFSHSHTHIKEECHSMDALTATTCLRFVPKLLKLYIIEKQTWFMDRYVIIYISVKTTGDQWEEQLKRRFAMRWRGEVGKQELHWALVIAGHQLRITVYKGEKSAGDLRSGCWRPLSSNLLRGLTLFNASLPFRPRTWMFNWNINFDPDKSFALDSYKKKKMCWFPQTSCLKFELSP